MTNPGGLQTATLPSGIAAVPPPQIAAIMPPEIGVAQGVLATVPVRASFSG